ncbi:hypothetical protein LPJ66_004374 [Kickxella alabastrina]|uniref:Uncharacterized protein n=1 Tax=Kickxella alabastrina TaxID=61397 RepID=A0ACC1II52_9FUNG|nr:hypothetical protein LPJ66_004374 [Kickxella alabastrina]
MNTVARKYALVEERAAHYMAEATLDEAEGAISELTTEYANQYVAWLVAENSRAETDTENAVFRTEMDALYTQLNESHRETSEVRCNISARLKKSEAFCAQEEAGIIAAECACARMSVAVTNLEFALSTANAAHTGSMAALAEAKCEADREAEAACSEALGLHAKLVGTSYATSQLEAKNAIVQQQLTDINE